MKRNVLCRRFSGLVAIGPALCGVLLWAADPVHGEIILTDPNLVSYWMLDEPAGTTGTNSVLDSKSTNHGTPAGGVTFGQASAMPSLGASSALFNGSTGKIDVAYSATLNPSTLTAAVWARVDGGSGTFRSPLTSRSSSPTQGYVFYAGSNNYWQFWSGTGSGWEGDVSNTTWPVSVIAGQWVQLVGTISGTSGAAKTLYMNGQPVYVKTGVAYAPNTGNVLRIGAGATENAGSFWFSGAVDNAAVLNQSLSAQAVANQYNSYSSYASDVLAAAPVGYWRLGEQSIATGQAYYPGAYAYNSANVASYKGTYSGGVTIRQLGTEKALTGDVDTAVAFDGSTGKVSIPYDAALNPANLTVAVWAKVAGGAGTYRSPITSRTSAGGGQGYVLYASETDKWEFWTGNGSTGWDLAIGPSVLLNQWAQVVGTFDAATGTKRLYVNGQLYVSQAGAYTPLSAAANPLSIGAGGDDGDAFFFNGKIDEAAVYGRALTRADVARQYEIGVKGAAEPNKIYGVTYTYTNAPNADSNYYHDELKEAGSFSGDLADGKVLSTGFLPDDTSVGWNAGTTSQITFDLGTLDTVHALKIGYCVYQPFANDGPASVQVSFSTDGTNFSAPVTYTGFTGTAVHNDLMIDIPNLWATHARLYFNGQTAHGYGKFLLDEITFYQGVPEPSAMVLLGIGGLGLLWRRRRGR
jgi:hypothetical protein